MAGIGGAEMTKNPFAQTPACWRMACVVPTIAVVALEEAFADISIATSSFEAAEKGEWLVEMLFPAEPKQAEVMARLTRMAAALAIDVPEPEIAAVPQKDWLAAVARDFPPISIGRFFVHGAHAKALAPPHAITLQVEAGTAFGSGEHATTSGCLRAIDQLARQRNITGVLDMGCGSGILAIAAAKCWPQARVLAVDIDAQSVTVARENARINRVANLVRLVCANGYACDEVKRAGPFPLIIANILARPLVAMSHDLAVNLAPGGVAILSGLLSTQESMVLSAHRRQGLRLTGRMVQNGWSTLVLGK